VVAAPRRGALKVLRQKKARISASQDSSVHCRKSRTGVSRKPVKKKSRAQSWISLKKVTKPWPITKLPKGISLRIRKANSGIEKAVVVGAGCRRPLSKGCMTTDAESCPRSTASCWKITSESYRSRTDLE